MKLNPLRMVRCLECDTGFMLHTTPDYLCPSCGSDRWKRFPMGEIHFEFYNIIGGSFSQQERMEARMFADDLMVGSMDEYRDL